MLPTPDSEEPKSIPIQISRTTFQILLLCFAEITPVVRLVRFNPRHKLSKFFIAGERGGYNAGSALRREHYREAGRNLYPIM